MIYLWWTLWFKRMHMSDKYKWIWARKMHLNSIAQPNEITAFKILNGSQQRRREKSNKQTNTDLLCVWRVWNDGGVSLNVLHGNWRKKNIWIGFFLLLFCGCLATSMSLSPSGVHTIFGAARFMKWIYRILYRFWVWNSFGCNAPFHFQLWLCGYCSNKPIYTHVQCCRPNKPCV